MKAEEFKEFCGKGKYGGSVLVQLKDPNTFTAMLNLKRELEPQQISAEQAAQLLAQQLFVKGIAQEKIEAMLAAGGPGPQPVPPVPMLVGELEIHGELLLLSYMTGETKFVVTLLPDDIKHVTSALNRHIHL